MPNDRWYNIDVGERRYVGLVSEIQLNKWGHQDNVYIAWSDETPPDYRENDGYMGINIHNLRAEFDVIRNGKNIP